MYTTQVVIEALNVIIAIRPSFYLQIIPPSNTDRYFIDQFPQGFVYHKKKKNPIIIRASVYYNLFVDKQVQVVS